VPCGESAPTSDRLQVGKRQKAQAQHTACSGRKAALAAGPCSQLAACLLHMLGHSTQLALGRISHIIGAARPCSCLPAAPPTHAWAQHTAGPQAQFISSERRGHARACLDVCPQRLSHMLGHSIQLDLGRIIHAVLGAARPCSLLPAAPLIHARSTTPTHRTAPCPACRRPHGRRACNGGGLRRKKGTHLYQKLSSKVLPTCFYLPLSSLITAATPRSMSSAVESYEPKRFSMFSAA